MISSELYHLKQALSADGIWFCYAGIFSPGVFNQAMRVLRDRNPDGEVLQNPSFPKKVFSIFLEQTRWMMEHQGEAGLDQEALFGSSSGIVLVSERDESPVLVLGMAIPDARIRDLQDQIEELKQGQGSDWPREDKAYGDLLKTIQSSKDGMTFEVLPKEGGMSFVSLSFTI